MRSSVVAAVVATLSLAGSVHSAPPSRESTQQSALVESAIRLTTDNWSQNIAKGTWFVEFLTPYSSSCKSFAQTWQELTVAKETLRTAYPDAPFSLAQVDCSVERQLCVGESVTHVPKLSLYRDGVQKESEFTGDREYTILSSYVDDQAAEYRKLKGVSDTPVHASSASKAQTDSAEIGPSPSPASSHPDIGPQRLGAEQGQAPAGPNPVAGPDRISDVSVKQGAPLPDVAAPDSVKPVVTPPKPPNADGRLLQYGISSVIRDEGALKAFLSSDSSQGPSIVKFFAPWCPHCRAMAAAYSRLAEALKGKVNTVEVDCEANREVCRAYEIQTFPTIRMYNEGEVSLYHGSRSFTAMQEWALRVGSTSGVRQITVDDLNEIANTDDVFFLYLHEHGTAENEINAYTKASRQLLVTQARAYRSSDAKLIERFKQRLVQSPANPSFSGILVFKDHDRSTPVAVYHPSQQENKAELAKDIGLWLDAKRFSTVIELEGSTFKDVMNNRQGMPVLLAALSDVHHNGRQEGTGSGSTSRIEEQNAFRDLALKWRQRNKDMDTSLSGTTTEVDQKSVLFAWIDADRWASAVQKYYDIRAADLPRIILANGARLQYYDLPSRLSADHGRNSAWLDADEIFQTLDMIWKGEGPPAKSSRTYLDRGVYETASFVESMLLWMSRHLFLTFLGTVILVAVVVTYLRHHASHMALHSQRLPTYGKAD